MSYHSQYGEDKWIVENLKLPPRGTFVEVGAEHGLNGSNSLHFEQAGWNGLLVEADPRQWHNLLVNRKCEKFFGAAGAFARPFSMSHIPSWSGFGREGQSVNVPVRRLDEICRLYQIPHDFELLSLDTEGTELEILSTFVGYAPQIIIIEYDTAGLPSAEQRIKDYFADEHPKVYRLVHRSQSNLIYYRSWL